MTPPDRRYPVLTQPWLDALLQASSEGIALFAPDGRVVHANSRLATLLRREPAALDGAPAERLFDDGRWFPALAAARSRGHWSGRLQAGDRQLEARVRIDGDGQGVLLCHDISERIELDRRAEVLAAELEQHVSRADETKEMLFEQSERLTTVYQLTVEALESATVRDTAERICGSLIDELGADNCALWLLDHDQELLRRIAAVGRRSRALPISVHRDAVPNVDEALSTGRATRGSGAGALGEFAVFVLPGRERSLGVLTIDHAPDLDKVQVYMPHVATGINNAIMAEELARANLQLRAIDQQKTEFLNIVAHDLRTPLTCIRTYTDLITMYVGESPETYAEFLQVISEETERLGELLDNFLDLARIENATLRYELEPLRLDEIGEHFVQVYRAKADAEQIRIEAWLDPAVPVVIADRRRVEQVVSNLLSNAFKFTPAGGQVRLTVRAEGDGAALLVDDSGSGVAVADRQRIFERFRQAGGGHARGGSGLGLAIAQAIVSHHGGRIWVEDADFGGARFIFTLPPEPPADSTAGRFRE